MAGIYIHIPFCRTACDYCDFHFSTSLKKKAELIKAIQEEIILRKDYLEGEGIESIYFGGGTPSILELNEIEDILLLLKAQYELEDNPEICLEANPDDLCNEKLMGLREIGINRLSIGIQSFIEEELKMLGRVHSSSQAIHSIENARKAGFKSVTIDLIYGIQNSRLENWKKNLDILKSMEIDHFSAYILSVEPKTVLSFKIKKGLKKQVDDELVREQYDLLKDFALANDFLHYEISNFSKKDCFSVHNTNYWKYQKYLGIGPSAHSFDLMNRRWNASVNTDYIKKINARQKFWEEERLNQLDHFNERLMLGLRTIWGVNLDDLFKIHESKSRQQFIDRVNYYEQIEFIKRTNSVLTLTDDGILFSDRILSDLFVED